jgi:hypothetical protein
MVQRQGTFGLRALPRGDFQLIFDVHFGQEEHLVLPLLNVSFHLSFQRTTVSCDLTRFQRAGESPGHSRANGGDDMVDGGRKFLCDRRPIPRLDTTMHAGANGLWKWFDEGLLDARLLGNDAHFGTMNQVSPGSLSFASA